MDMAERHGTGRLSPLGKAHGGSTGRSDRLSAMLSYVFQTQCDIKSSRNAFISLSIIVPFHT
jgi:hypothetical protein